MKSILVGASDVRYQKNGQQKQFYVLRCLASVKSYKDSGSEKLGYEQKELFVKQAVHEQAKAIKRYPAEVELSCDTDPFKGRVNVTSLQLVS
jgi:hypothetical protein